MRPHSRERRPGRRLPWVLGLVLLAIALTAYLAAYAFASDRLPQDTTVAGVDVGGMRPDRAERALTSRIGPRLDDPIELVVGQQQFTVDPEAAGLSVDVDASVAQVPVGRSWNPADMWEVFVGGGGEYEAVVRRREGPLAQQLRRIAEQVERPVVEGSVELGPDGPAPTYPRPGARLDVQAAAAAVVAAYPARREPVQLTLDEREPSLSRADVDAFLEEVARPALAAPVTFDVDGEEIVLTPEEYAPALRAVTEDGSLRLEVARGRLVDAVRPSLGPAAQAPRDATFRIVGGEPRVVPSRPGVTVDRDALAEALLAAVGEPEGERRREVATASVEPDLSTEEARELQVREKVSEFTTYYPHEDYRNVNIGRAAELVGGTVLEPGETFSLNETVGERTRENGFTEGFIISDGVFKEELGGGVSQVATTTFNAMFFAGLEDVEHKPHSFYIDRYPVGREATVAWPTVDLRFRNDTDHGVFISTRHVPSTYASQGALTVQMWSTKVWDVTSRTGERYAYTAPETRYLTGDDCVPNVGYSGFSIDVVRVFRRVGETEVDHTERFSTVYTPSDSVVCQ